MSKVLFISTAYAPEPVGSAPVVADMAEWLADKGWEVQILTVRPSYPSNEVFAGYQGGAKDEEVLNGVSVSRGFAPPPKGGGLIKRGLFEGIAFLQTLRLGLRRRNRDARYVVSICPSALMIMTGWLLAGRKKRHIVVVHDIQSGLAKSLSFTRSNLVASVIKGVERFLFSRADHLVVLTQGMRDTLSGMGVRRPMTILPPHIDETVIYPVAPPSHEVPALLYSGNIGRKQGLEQLLDLTAELERRNIVHRLIIRGQGNNRCDLERKAQTRKLENLSFEDFVPKEDLNDSMAAADLHLVPQLPEGADFAVPSKIYAIMSAGKAFVATALEGSPLDKLAKESGAFLAVPPGDVVAFADAVASLLRDRQRLLQLGENGRKYIVETCTRDQVMGSFEACLMGLVTYSLNDKSDHLEPPTQIQDQTAAQ